MTEGNGFDEYKRLILHELKELKYGQRELREDLDNQIGRIGKRLDLAINDRDKQIAGLRVDIATLKAKSGLWGLLGGLLPATGALIYFVIKL